jgi:uncharacterized damage-inducible protein DinB
MPITAEQAIFLRESFLPSLENEHQITVKVLKAIPEGKADYRPDPNSMSAFDLAWHITSSEVGLLGTAVKGEFAPATLSKPASMAEMVRMYSANFQEIVAGLRARTGEQLAQEVSFRGLFQMPAVMYMNFAMCHCIHHRGQLSVYLRPMGQKVPSMYGESFDDKQARLAAAS